MRDKLIAKAEGYRVYRGKGSYYIAYTERDPMAPYPTYRTLVDVREALYYAGCLPTKTAELG